MIKLPHCINCKYFVLSITLTLILTKSVVAQTEYHITEKLFAESDIVIQGSIQGVECWLDQIGVSECKYTITVDSIYKGNPRIYAASILEFIHNTKNSQEVTIEDIYKTVDVTYFNRQCPYYMNISPDLKTHIKDNCFEVNDSLIVFLKDTRRDKLIISDTIYPYKMVDQWAGTINPSSYLASYLRKLNFK